MKTLLNQSDDLTRRRFAQGAASAFLGVGMLPVTPKSFAAGAGAATAKQIATAKRVIYLYMGGGMTHLDTFDTKPGAETQGPVESIDTTGDFQLSEYLPRLAKQGKHLGIVNSLNSKTGAHEQGNYIMHTSYEMRGTIKHPAMSAWLLKFEGRDNMTLPNSVVVGGGSRHPGAGFFESRYGPVMIGDPTKGLQNVKTRIKEEDFNYRFGLSQKLGRGFREEYGIKDVRSYTAMYDDAVKLMQSPDLDAFDLSKEPEAIREAYGTDKFGQGCLLARRLAENGVKYIEVALGGWDTHSANFVRVPDRCETLDRGMGTLISDLESRGMLDDTLIVLASEFGRTPRINQNVGRDHYPRAFSAVFAGGGIVGGQKYGATNETGEYVVENKVSPPDINATIGYALGLPLDQVLYSPSKRPFTAAHKGQPIYDLFA